MKLASHQADFAPYLGFWAKLNNSDVFVIHRSGRFEREKYHSRVKVGTDGSSRWLSVPVSCPGPRISDTVMAQNVSIETITGVMAQAHRGMRFRKSAESVIRGLAHMIGPGKSLSDFNIELVRNVCRIFGFKQPIVESDEDYHLHDDVSVRIAERCVRNGCNTYLSGSGGRNYLDETVFAARGIKVEWSAPLLPDGAKTVSVLSAIAAGAV